MHLMVLLSQSLRDVKGCLGIVFDKKNIHGASSIPARH
jgi:hypothetical protein